MKYPDSAWYKTGDIRIAPGFMGFMQAQELWRKDSYDSYGEISSYQTKWKRMDAVPFEIDNNFYSAMAATKKEHTGFIWKHLISYFPGLGYAAPTPSTPAETQERMRNYQRKSEEDRQIEDGFEPNPEVIAEAAKRNPTYAEKVRAALGDPKETVHLKPGPDLYGHIR